MEKIQDDFLYINPKKIDYTGMKISDLLKIEKEKIIYEYDFNYGWKYEIVLNKMLPMVDKFKNPFCINGKMNCPPEDCGGVWRYYPMLKILKQPDHEGYENYMEWPGDEFDPEQFAINPINKKLIKENFGF